MASTRGWWTVALRQAVCPARARVCLLSKAPAGCYDGRNQLKIHWKKACLELLRAQFLTLPLFSLVMKLKSEGKATTILSVSASVAHSQPFSSGHVLTLNLRFRSNGSKKMVVSAFQQWLLGCKVKE